MKQFKTKTGLLTAYALSCGYIETFESKGRRVVLSKEHHVFHVQNISNESRYWESFDKLSDARKAYKLQCEVIK